MTEAKMDFVFDKETRETALTENETVLQLMTPGKKAFFFYRVRIPTILLCLVFAVLLAVNVVHSIVKSLSFSGIWLYGAGLLLAVAISFFNYLVQKRLYAKKAYYVTDKRILLTGGLFHLKYRTLNYRFIGSVVLKRTPFSKALGIESYSINLSMNINKQFTVKFFSIAGMALSYLENASETYKLIINRSCIE